MNFDSMTILKDDERVLASDLAAWLPDRIIDCHVHACLDQSGLPMLNNLAQFPGATFNWFPIEEHLRLFDQLLPGVLCRTVLFGFPGKLSQNGYPFQLSQQDGSEVLPIFLADQRDTAEMIMRKLQSEFLGLKMYPTRSQKHNHQTRITDVFPVQVLTALDALAMPVIVHLPGVLQENAEELEWLAKRFPSVRFIVAHMGNMYCFTKDTGEAFRKLVTTENIYCDTAMVADSEVIAEAVATLGRKRVLFGSDAPFSYLRCRHVISNHGTVRLESQKRFSWVKEEDYREYQLETKRFVMMHLSILAAVRDALRHLGRNYGDAAKKRIFWYNSLQLFQRRV